MKDPTLAATIITGLSVEPLELPLTEPFSIASGSQPIASNLLVTVELADGTRGLGEAAPFPAVSGETAASAAQAIECCRVALIGADVRGLRRLSAQLTALCAEQHAARCGLEQALLDAYLRQAGLPMWSYFGGSGTELHTDMTITIGDVEHAARAARAIARRGMHDVKLKVGGPGVSIAEEVERVEAVVAAAPGLRLCLDGNGAYAAETALFLVQRLHALGIELALFEQPVARDDREGLLALSKRAGVPICADESARTAADVLALIKDGAAQAVNLKLMKSGLWETLAMYELSRAAGLKLMIGGMVESCLSMSVSAHLAAGLGGFDFVDLDTPFFVAEHPFSGGMMAEGARLSVAHVEAGHGVTRRLPAAEPPHGV